MFRLIHWRIAIVGLPAVCCIGLMIAFATPHPLTNTNEALLTKPLLTDSTVPPQVRSILQRACGNCHSDNTVLPWYAAVPPVSWQVRRDVDRGRASMNLSRWSEYSDGKQRALTFAISNAAKTRIMPPPGYVLIHSEARISGTDVKELEKWAAAVKSRSRTRDLHQ